jgi:hypothetical protein
MLCGMRAFLVALIAIVANSHPAGAEPQHKWYGWQTLALDGAAAVTFFSAPDTPVGTGAAATYLLSAPIVHLAHGGRMRGLTSMPVRACRPSGRWAACSSRGSTAVTSAMTA